MGLVVTYHRFHCWQMHSETILATFWIVAEKWYFDSFDTPLPANVFDLSNYLQCPNRMLTFESQSLHWFSQFVSLRLQNWCKDHVNWTMPMISLWNWCHGNMPTKYFGRAIQSYLPKRCQSLAMERSTLTASNPLPAKRKIDLNFKLFHMINVWLKKFTFFNGFCQCRWWCASPHSLFSPVELSLLTVTFRCRRDILFVDRPDSRGSKLVKTRFDDLNCWQKNSSNL